jgi:adenine-specific DNA methylase
MAREDLENEEEEITSASEKDRLLRILSKLDPGNSEQREYYDWLTERIATLSEAERNEKQTEQIDNAKWSWILPTIIQGVSAVANTTISVLASRRSVRDITRYEDDGNIVKTAATGFINKPR